MWYWLQEGQAPVVARDAGADGHGEGGNCSPAPAHPCPTAAKNWDPTTPENQAKALERYVKGFLRWALESDKRKAEYGHTPMPQIVIPDDPYA